MRAEADYVHIVELCADNPAFEAGVDGSHEGLASGLPPPGFQRGVQKQGVRIRLPTRILPGRLCAPPRQKEGRGNPPPRILKQAPQIRTLRTENPEATVADLHCRKVCAGRDQALKPPAHAQDAMRNGSEQLVKPLLTVRQHYLFRIVGSSLRLESDGKVRLGTRKLREKILLAVPENLLQGGEGRFISKELNNSLTGNGIMPVAPENIKEAKGICRQAGENASGARTRLFPG